MSTIREVLFDLAVQCVAADWILCHRRGSLLAIRSRKPKQSINIPSISRASLLCLAAPVINTLWQSRPTVVAEEVSAAAVLPETGVV